jgi:hypothetical protein
VNKALCAKMKKKAAACKHCKGTRVLSMTTHVAPAPPAPAPFPAPAPESASSITLAVEVEGEGEGVRYSCGGGRRVRKPSSKMMEIITSAKKKRENMSSKNSLVAQDESGVVAMDGDECPCPHCQHDVMEAEVFAASLLPKSNLFCSPLTDPRHFSISAEEKKGEAVEIDKEEEEGGAVTRKTTTIKQMKIKTKTKEPTNGLAGDQQEAAVVKKKKRGRMMVGEGVEGGQQEGNGGVAKKKK